MMKNHNKYNIKTQAKVTAGIISLIILIPSLAFAAGDPFADAFKFIVKYTNGSLGKLVCIASLIIGLALGAKGASYITVFGVILLGIIFANAETIVNLPFN